MPSESETLSRMVLYVPGVGDAAFRIPAIVASALKYGTDAEVNTIALAALAEGARRKELRAQGVDFDGMQAESAKRVRDAE